MNGQSSSLGLSTALVGVRARESRRVGEVCGFVAKDGRLNSELCELFGAKPRPTPVVCRSKRSEERIVHKGAIFDHFEPRPKVAGEKWRLVVRALLSAGLVFCFTGCALFSSGAPESLPTSNSAAPELASQGRHDSEGNILAQFGNYVLNLFSVRPATTEFSQEDALIDATETFSREEEYFLGRAVAAHIIARYQLIDTPEMRVYLDRLGKALASYSNQPETFGGYHFAVIDTDAFNAVSAPGGFIFVSRGILQRVTDEEELAAVLAHEIAHVTGRHGIRSLSRESLNGALQAAGLLVGSLNCDMVLQQAGLVFAAVVDELVDTLLEKGYSRELEFEADREAAVLLARAGLPPSGMGRVLIALDVMEEAPGGKPKAGGWFSTHPSASERLQKLNSNVVQSPFVDAEDDSGRTVAAVRLKRFRTAVASLSSGMRKGV